MSNIKQHKDVDILKELLPEIDQRNYRFFSDLPVFYKRSGQKDTNKGIDFVPLLRWASAVGNEEVDWAEARKQGRQKGDKKGKWPSKVSDEPLLTEYYVESINDLVNKNFWEMTKHPELLYKLFALAGCGQNTTHIWIKQPTKSQKGKVIELIKKVYPCINDEEMAMFLEMNTNQDLIELAQMVGYQDEELEALKKELKKK